MPGSDKDCLSGPRAPHIESHRQQRHPPLRASRQRLRLQESKRVEEIQEGLWDVIDGSHSLDWDNNVLKFLELKDVVIIWSYVGELKSHYHIFCRIGDNIKHLAYHNSSV